MSLRPSSPPAPRAGRFAVALATLAAAAAAPDCSARGLADGVREGGAGAGAAGAPGGGQGGEGGQGAQGGPPGVGGEGGAGGAGGGAGAAPSPFAWARGLSGDGSQETFTFFNNKFAAVRWVRTGADAVALAAHLDGRVTLGLDPEGNEVVEGEPPTPGPTPRPSLFFVTYRQGDGRVLGARRFGGGARVYVTSAVADGRGNVAVGGFFEDGPIELEDGFALDPPPANDTDGFVVVFDAASRATAALRVSAAVRNARRVNALAFGEDGSLHVAGEFGDQATFRATAPGGPRPADCNQVLSPATSASAGRDGFLLRLAPRPAGAGPLACPEPARHLGGDEEQIITALAPLPGGRLAVGGFWRGGALDGGGIVVPKTAAADAFVFALAASGAAAWPAPLSFGGNPPVAADRVVALAAGPDGSLFAVGQWSNPNETKLPGCPLNGRPTSQLEAFALKLGAADGSCAWAASFGVSAGDDSARAVAVDPFGRPLVAGVGARRDLSLVLSKVNGPAPLELPGQTNGRNPFVLRFRAAGDGVDEVTAFDGLGESVFDSVALADDGLGFFLAGSYTGRPAPELPPAPDADLFVGRLPGAAPPAAP